ncbi:MAG: HIT family protein, partial [Hymenobacter sp.]
MPTIFSRIVSGELPAYKVAEDADHLAFLDITPLVEGHTLVIPKKEIDYIFDMTPQALAALHVFAQRVAKGVRHLQPNYGHADAPARHGRLHALGHAL